MSNVNQIAKVTPPSTLKRNSAPLARKSTRRAIGSTVKVGDSFKQADGTYAKVTAITKSLASNEIFVTVNGKRVQVNKNAAVRLR